MDSKHQQERHPLPGEELLSKEEATALGLEAGPDGMGPSWEEMRAAGTDRKAGHGEER